MFTLKNLACQNINLIPNNKDNREKLIGINLINIIK